MRTGWSRARTAAALAAVLIFVGTAAGGYEEDLRRGKGTGIPEGFLKAERLATLNLPDGKPRAEKDVKALTEALKGHVKAHLDTREKAAKELTELLRGRGTDSASKWSRICGDRQRILRGARDKYRRAFSTKEMEPAAFEVISEFLEAEISQWSKVDSTGKAMIVQHDLLLKQTKILVDEERRLGMRIDFFHQEGQDFEEVLDEVEENYVKDWSPDSVSTSAEAGEFLARLREDLGRMAGEEHAFRILRANVDADTEEIREFVKRYDARKVADEVSSVNSRDVFDGTSAAYYARFEKDWEADLSKVNREYADAFEKYTKRFEQWDDMVREEYAEALYKHGRILDTATKLEAAVKARMEDLEEKEAEEPGDEDR